MTQVFVGIGSNVEAEKHVRAAIGLLREKFGALQLSPVYRNPPFGFEGDDFLNLVAAFEDHLSAPILAAVLSDLEARGGRQRGAKRFAPRTLDLDLLLYGAQVSEQPKLPRSDVLKYAFVLKPLTDLAPDHRHPVTGKTFAQHWQEFTGSRDSLQRVELAGL